MIEIPLLSFLILLVGSPIAKTRRSKEIYLVLEEKEQSWQFSSLLYETKEHLQENQGFLFFFF